MSATDNLRIAPALLATFVLVTFVAVAIALPASAESTAELLEKGIYAEQTVGDLTGAIDIYTRVIESTQANRSHAAQAQFRLAMCHLKQGSAADAKSALDQLIREYPEQTQLVAQAREQLPAVEPGLAVGLAPWSDGELLEYQISLPTGKVLGKMYLAAESTVVDGVDAWRLEQRKFIFNSADSQGVSRVLVDHQTQQPISSTFRHGVLGNADATYRPDGVEITGGATDGRIDHDHQIYDNEQSLHLLRVLPLAPGYKAQIGFLPTWTAEILQVGFEVTGKEICQVPAGEFECHVVKADLGHTIWVATGAERFPVRLEAGGARFELTKVARTEPGVLVSYKLADFGVAGKLPAGWLFHEQRSAERVNSSMVRFLDPEAAAISAVEIDRCPRGRCPALKETSERELAGAKRRFDGFELRQGSWTEKTIGDRPAISFIGDYQRNQKPWVQYRFYTFVDDVRLEFIFRTPKARFEKLQEVFDSVAESAGAE